MPDPVGPVTLAQIKADLKVETAAEDDFLQRTLAGALSHIETQCGLVCIQRDQEFSFDHFGRAIMLPLFPVDAESVQVKYLDRSGEEQSLVVRAVKRARRTFLAPEIGACWPADVACGLGVITVNASVGYANPSEVPDDIKTAIRIFCGDRYRNREGGALPAAIDDLINEYRPRGV